MAIEAAADGVLKKTDAVVVGDPDAVFVLFHAGAFKQFFDDGLVGVRVERNRCDSGATELGVVWFQRASWQMHDAVLHVEDVGVCVEFFVIDEDPCVDSGEVDQDQRARFSLDAIGAGDQAGLALLGFFDFFFVEGFGLFKILDDFAECVGVF